MRNSDLQTLHDEVSEHFTLMLLYIHSWKSLNQDKIQTFSFKGFDFETLQKLRDNDLIHDEGKSASYVQLTPDGVAMAKDFMCALTQLDI
jgi:Domain of unknown function (DUF6429)